MQIVFSEPNQWGKFDVTVAGIITIKGCKHMVSDKYNFIAMPQYLKRDKDGAVVNNTNNTKTGKPQYIADFSIDKEFEKEILAAYKATLGSTAEIDEDSIPF